MKKRYYFSTVNPTGFLNYLRKMGLEGKVIEYYSDPLVAEIEVDCTEEEYYLRFERRINRKRIQRKREKSWRMPEHTVSITRPGQWGNPVKLVGDIIYIDASHRRAVMDKWVYLCHGTPEDVVEIYRYLVGMTDKIRGDIKGNVDIDTHREMLAKKDFTPLIGKDLACFCPLGAPCHGDVLLKKISSMF